MSRKLILWLVGISLAALVVYMAVFFFAFFTFVPTYATACSSSDINSGSCQSSPVFFTAAPFYLLSLVGLVAGVPGLIAEIGALIRAAKMQSWGWFVVVLLCGTIGTLIYALVWPQPTPQHVVLVGYAPPYQPPYPPQQYPPQQPYQSPYTQQYPPQQYPPQQYPPGP